MRVGERPTSYCEKCDWMTDKSAGQNFHENRAKFDQKSYVIQPVRAKGERDSACFWPGTALEYGARRSELW